MRITLKKIVCFVLAVYFVITCYTFYKLLQKSKGKSEDAGNSSRKRKADDDSWNPWGEEFEQEGWRLRVTPAPLRAQDGVGQPRVPVHPVHPQAEDAGDQVQEMGHLGDPVLFKPDHMPVANSRNVGDFQGGGDGDPGDLDAGEFRAAPVNGEQDLPAEIQPGREEIKKIRRTGPPKIVEIWGKAAIGNYLWEHIFRGSLVQKLGGLWSYGEEKVQEVTFKFRTGPGVVPAKVPQDVRNLVIVLNGREEAKVEFSSVWLNYLASSLPKLVNVAVVLLGNEMCSNSWLDPYLERNGGLIRLVFLTYDSKDVDNVRTFQWPLGVATYRGFPVVDPTELMEHARTQRQYQCNFLGTVYPGSSRETLTKIIDSHNLHQWCYVNPRNDWLPNESQDSRLEYYHALKNSDFTLHPVGKNTECYRLYEAMAYGSIPIIENRMTTGYCGNNTVFENAPLRLLKQHKAPVIYIYDWKELPSVLEKYRRVRLETIIEMRVNILSWYDKFKTLVRDRFVSTVKNKFFDTTEDLNSL